MRKWRQPFGAGRLDNRPELLSAAAGLTAGGGTPTPDALRASINDLPEAGNRRVVLISDGASTCGPACPVAAELAATEEIDFTIFTVGFNAPSSAVADLTCIANETGGGYVEATDTESLVDAIVGATGGTGVSFASWSTGDVHAHAAGDTNLEIHPSCGGLANPIGATDCADLVVDYVAEHSQRFDADWLILTEHAPWLGFQRNAGAVLYDRDQGAEQWDEIVRAATATTGADMALLMGLELGTSAPSCSNITGGALPFVSGPWLDSPGHYGVYYSSGFIDDGLFDCSETGSNGYVGDTADIGGFGGINHPRNEDGGSPWHCWNTVSSGNGVEGSERSPILLDNQDCAVGIDFYAAAEPSDNKAFRSIEIVSGNNLPTRGTLRQWDAFLQNRFRVAAVGGGDGHTAPRKQDPKNALSCLVTQDDGEAFRAYFACFIDKGGAVRDPNVGKTGGSGRTMVRASKSSLAGAGVKSEDHPVRTAIVNGATVATNGPAVLASIDGAAPGESVDVNGNSVSIRVAWQETFKHAGDAPGYCSDADRAATGKCPNTMDGLTFDDIKNGLAPPPALVATVEPDEIVIVVGPRSPCGRDRNHCADTVERYSFSAEDLSDEERAANSMTRVVTIPDGEAYVRVEWYADTGASNSDNDDYIDNRLWDFGAFTSPIYITRDSGVINTNTVTAGSAAVAMIGAGAQAEPPTIITVLDRYGRPVEGADVSVVSVALDGQVNGTRVNGVATGSDGSVMAQLVSGDHIASATNAGCGDIFGLDQTRSDVFHAPTDELVVLYLDCGEVDDTPPTVTITDGPIDIVPTYDVEFGFTAGDDSGLVQTYCLLDQVYWDEFAMEPCESPIRYESVGGGSHTFQVVAFDAAGNPSEVATSTFFVATPKTEPPLYRVRQVPQGRGAADPNIVVERNVAAAGLNDFDPDGDGWAVLGETKGAGERGYLDGFELAADQHPVVIVDVDKPPTGNRCYSATVDLSRVRGPKTRRLQILADPTDHPDCYADGASDTFPVDGPVYR